VGETSDPRTAQIGDTLRPFSRLTHFANWNRYAAVNYEFIPIHMDDEAAHEAGHDGAIGMGNLQWSYLHNMLRAYLDGAHGRIARIGVQYRERNLKGDRLTARGVVTAISEDAVRRTLELEVWVENQRTQRTARGTATVTVPR
jgi:acyl dehydratase